MPGRVSSKKEPMGKGVGRGWALEPGKGGSHSLYILGDFWSERSGETAGPSIAALSPGATVWLNSFLGKPGETKRVVHCHNCLAVRNLCAFYFFVPLVATLLSSF